MDLMNEILKIAAKECERIEKRNKAIKEMFKTPEELGLMLGDMIIFKDGEILYVTDLKEEGFKYKNIAEVKRPVKWKEVEIKLPKRTRRNKKEDK